MTAVECPRDDEAKPVVQVTKWQSQLRVFFLCCLYVFLYVCLNVLVVFYGGGVVLRVKSCHGHRLLAQVSTDHRATDAEEAGSDILFCFGVFEFLEVLFCFGVEFLEALFCFGFVCFSVALKSCGMVFSCFKKSKLENHASSNIKEHEILLGNAAA